jgi:hypothetical protein
MHAVNVHQLKNNPSEAWRKVKDAPVIVLESDRPTAIMLNLDDDTLLNQPDVKLALVTELFRCGHLSLGRAARWRTWRSSLSCAISLRGVFR